MNRQEAITRQEWLSLLTETLGPYKYAFTLTGEDYIPKCELEGLGFVEAYESAHEFDDNVLILVFNSEEIIDTVIKAVQKAGKWFTYDLVLYSKIEENLIANNFFVKKDSFVKGSDIKV